MSDYFGSFPKIPVSDSVIEQKRRWLSERMKEKGLMESPLYTLKGWEESIFMPYADLDFEVCFRYQKNRDSLNVHFSNGKDSFYLSDYLMFHSHDLTFNPYDELTIQSLEEGLSKIFGYFDRVIDDGIKNRKIPNIPSSGDLKAVFELKLKSFMEDLGFSGKGSPAGDGSQKYVFKKGDIQLIVATAGRLDDGYMGIQSSKEFFSYDDLLRKIASNNVSVENFVSHWEAGGYYGGDYYKVAIAVRKTIEEILENIFSEMSLKRKIEWQIATIVWGSMNMSGKILAKAKSWF